MKEKAALSTLPILAVLAAHDYAITATATALGVSRKTLWQKMKR
jgi:transcriptional regulator of acetoin/glycerol metabolism